MTTEPTLDPRAPRTSAEPTGRLRVLLADDHALFRESVARLLNAEPDIEVVGQAADGLAAVREARRHRPDLVLLESAMPGGDGITATREIKLSLPYTLVVLLTGAEDQETMVKALLAGADGYFLKRISVAELLEVLRGARRGEPIVAGQSLETYRRMRRGPAPSRSRLDELTMREREIVQLVGDGASNKEIAHQLHLSTNTVKTHMRHILDKLQIRRRQEAYPYARHLRLQAHGHVE